MLNLQTRDVAMAVWDGFQTEEDSIYEYPIVSFDPAKTALVIIDPWQTHPNEGWAARAAANMEDYLVPLIAICRAKGVRVVYAPTNRTIHASVAPVVGELVIDTPGSNADDTVLDQQLLAWGVDTILYAGYASNMCVVEKRASARWMNRIRAGRRYIFVRDASIGFEMPQTLAAESLHHAAVFHFEYMWGSSTTVAEVIASFPQPRVVLDLAGGVVADGSNSAHSVSALGNAKVDDGSFLFDGVSDKLSVPDHADWHFGGADFTIEFDGYALTAGDPGSIIIGQADSAGAGIPSWLLSRNATHIGFHANNAIGTFNLCSVYASFDTSPAIWQSYRVEKRSGTLSIKVNGTTIASGPCGFMPDVNRPLTIGGASIDNNDLRGRIRNLKITV